MKQDDAVALIRDAVGESRGEWADIGAGRGTFTEALASLLHAGSRIHAIDRDRAAVETLRHLVAPAGIEVVALEGDFNAPLRFGFPLDGILLANVLHYAPDPSTVLHALAALLTPTGRVVVVEYDQRAANAWVPYPIPLARLRDVAEKAGLGVPVVTAQRPSEYSGVLYAAVIPRRG